MVEYVYKTPWSLKTYDGREKSLLRGATRDMLPESVVNRVKLAPVERTRIERVLDLAVWIDMYRPTIVF